MAAGGLWLLVPTLLIANGEMEVFAILDLRKAEMSVSLNGSTMRRFVQDGQLLATDPTHATGTHGGSLQCAFRMAAEKVLL